MAFVVKHVKDLLSIPDDPIIQLTLPASLLICAASVPWGRKTLMAITSFLFAVKGFGALVYPEAIKCWFFGAVFLICVVQLINYDEKKAVTSLYAHGLFFLTVLLCHVFSNTFSQWHVYGMGGVLLVAVNDFVGADINAKIQNLRERTGSTKEE